MNILNGSAYILAALVVLYTSPTMSCKCGWRFAKPILAVVQAVAIVSLGLLGIAVAGGWSYHPALVAMGVTSISVVLACYGGSSQGD